MRVPLVMNADDSPNQDQYLRLATLGIPAVASALTGEPWMAVAYLPLLTIGEAVEANPAAPMLLSTLLYDATITAVEQPDPGFVFANLVNVALAVLFLWGEAVDFSERSPEEGELERFDQRLAARLARRK
jgi:hypothetical protein